MTETSTVRFRLTGALAGKTIRLGQFSFVDGVIDISGSPAELGVIEKILDRNWRVERVVRSNDAPSSSEVEARLPPKREVLTTRQKSDLLEALKDLDTERDDLWTTEGKPTLKALEGSVKNVGLTRRLVSEVWPEFDRTEARRLAAKPKPEATTKRE